MKILLDCSNVRVGGAVQCAISIISFAKDCDRHDWVLILSENLSMQIPTDWDLCFGSVLRLRRSNGVIRQLMVSGEVKKFEQINEVDIVYSLFGPTYWSPKSKHLVGFAKSQYIYPDVELFAEKKLISRAVKTFLYKIKLMVHKKLFLMADYLVAETETVRIRAAKSLGFSLDAFFVVKNSYSQVFEDSIMSLDKLERQDKNCFRIFTPSAWYPHKNLEIIPSVAKALSGMTSAKFLFVLTLDPNSLPWKQIEKEAVRLEVGGALVTVGKVDHEKLASHYMGADVVFLPTLLECSSAVYPESMMSSKPIVTSDLDFAHELCGEAADYFDPRNPEMAARTIFEYIRKPKKISEKKGLLTRVLKENYPAPKDKFEAQLKLLEQIGSEYK